ncbi:HlyD family secretion protein [Hymenobacter sp. DH14]|uniref:HlyD family secretion protein n=1 Tax=Hymenobacter cyanobacteriorum TaxID=2926463 RepID=A0A9X2AF66_9BACT|nr:HlyD family secretion protein [Hymenobacter cyanobacteriorum]MCI1187941.1 HlyD family secretion protein [Hymenobacter cyanobacteriorum]
MPTTAPFVERRAEEVQDLMARQPSWFLRWSVTLLAVLLALGFAGAWLIHFPDLVPATFTLTSVNAPKAAPAHSSGRLVRLLVHDGVQVPAGAPLAYLESTAQPREVAQLGQAMRQAWTLASAGQLEAVARLPLERFRQLGELQGAYQPFALAHLRLQTFFAQGIYVRRRALLQQEAGDLQAMARNLAQQQAIQGHALALAEADYRVQQQLAQQRVIAPLDLQHEETKLLAHQLPYRQMAASRISNTVAQRGKQQELLELDKALIEQRDQFLQALNALQSAADEWERKYVVRAPGAGRVYFPAPLQENQQVATEQVLFYVAPGHTAYLGQMRIPQQNAGKVRAGQTVLIRFNGYPYQEFGLVRGTIRNVAEIPLEEGFMAEVSLPTDLITSRGQKLTYKLGMTASAEVITQDRRLLQRLFSPLLSALHNVN